MFTDLDFIITTQYFGSTVGYTHSQRPCCCYNRKRRLWHYLKITSATSPLKSSASKVRAIPHNEFIYNHVNIIVEHSSPVPAVRVGFTHRGVLRGAHVSAAPEKCLRLLCVHV